MYSVADKMERTLREVLPEAIALRRAIHRNPDLSGEETSTVEKVLAFLQDSPLSFRRTERGNALVANLGGDDGERLAFRGDMDALPLREETGLPYASEDLRAMHACGHDFHTAILAGTAKILSQICPDPCRPLRFLFQPSEEDSPRGGSRTLIEMGALEKVSALYGLHLWPELCLGEVATKRGPLMAASDRLTVRIEGVGSHAASPHRGIDALTASAYVATAVQSLLSRRIDPFEPVVLTFGRIEGGDRYNVLAHSVSMEGTCRTFSPDVRDFMEREISGLSCSVAQGMGARCSVEYERGYPALMNDSELAESFLRDRERLLPHLKAIDAERPSMIAEDFSFMAAQVPSLFFWLGCRPAERPLASFPSLHSSRFVPDEAVLEKGLRLFCFLALR
ncbi:M20 metallopeptidase family protein [Aminirod propionatiphilus]|uniref:Amidohydrolase n=1 Tax=Aminirod propionatiphilus TaxID=3415223 RepID=A0ACD1DY68_9BACT|nr:amidohydrolase [Synergistota bacterium]